MSTNYIRLKIEGGLTMECVLTESGRTRHIATPTGWARCGAMAYIPGGPGSANGKRAAKWPVCKRCKDA